MQRMPVLSETDMSLFELKTRYVRNGCRMRIMKEDDLFAAICTQMGWEQVKEEQTGQIERVEVAEDGVEIVKTPQEVIRTEQRNFEAYYIRMSGWRSWGL